MNKFQWFQAGLTAVLFAAGTCLGHAGTYSQDFTAFSVGATNFSDGSQLFSTQPASLASVQDGTYKELQLTASGVLASTSAFELPDLDPNNAVYAFSAKWNAAVYGTFPSAGDGFSLNFGQLASSNLISGAVESGYGTGLCFSVQTAGANPGFYLLVNGTVLASAAYNSTTQWGVNSGTRHLFELDWNYSTGTTVRMDGQTIFTNVPTTGFNPQPGDRLVWAARSVNYSEYLRLDNIVVMTGGNLTTIPAGSPYFTDANSYYLHPGSYAFDGDTNTYWLETATTGYAGATINSPVAVYALTSLHDNNGAVNDPQAWKLDGSNDGTTWTALGTGSGYFLNHRETRCWMTSNTNSFTDCRLNVTANNGGSIIKLYDVTLYRFQAQQGPPAASLNYQPASATPFGTVLTATLPTSYGNQVTLNWGTNASYGNTVAFPLANRYASATLTYTVPPVTLAVPIHYRFTYQYGSSPGTNDIIGADAVVQPAGLQAIAYAPTANAPLGFNNNSIQSIPHGALTYVADSVACFDSQNRGVLDLLTTGQSVAADGSAYFGSQIFLNTNPITSGTAFTTTKPAAINTSIAGALFNSFSAIFNFSNDNYPSWTVGGDNTFYAELLVNAGSNFGLSLGLDWLVNGSFFKNVLVPVSGFNVGNQHIAGPGRGVAADFDQDGFDDLLILNQNGGFGLAGVSSYFTYTPSAFLLHNVPNAGQSTAQIGVNITPRLFASVATTLPTPSVNSGNGQTIAVGDVNNDGYPDLFIALGQPDGAYIARIYLNQQGKGFIPGPDIVLPGSTTGLVFPSAVLADFNGDGNLDLLLAGWGDSTAPTTVIYYGDGTGHFTNSNIALPQRSYASVAVGDLFNHGRNDIVIGGKDNNTLVLRNDGGSFTAFDWGVFPAVSMSGRNIALADVDNDGKLDIAAGDQEDNGAPQYWNGYPLAVYRNAMNIPTNAPPFAPTNLVSQVGSGTVTLQWGNASDDLTSANLLTYNLRIGTNTLGTDTVSPLANLTTGWRKVVAPGNRGHTFQCTYHLSPGTYYWSVQAVDGAFAGGAWAAEGTFTVPAVPVAVADALSRPDTTPVVKVLLATLLENDMGPGGETLNITAVGDALPSGATVVIAGAFAVYTAPTSTAGNGSFTYTLSDGAGGHSVIGTVTVTETASSGTAGAPNSASLVHTGGDFALKFLGLPGRNYGVQYSTNSLAPYTWIEFAPPVNLVAPTSGVLGYTDVSPPDPLRLYRAVLLP